MNTAALHLGACPDCGAPVELVQVASHVAIARLEHESTCSLLAVPAASSRTTETHDQGPASNA